MCPGIHVHIDTNGSESEAIRYAFSILLATVDAPIVFHRAKPFLLSSDAVLITYTRFRVEPVHAKHLVICSTERLWDHYGKTASLPSVPLLRLTLRSLGVDPNPRVQDPLILPYVAPNGPTFRKERRVGQPISEVSIVTGADLVASTFFWITRYEESLIGERDEFGRVPQTRLLAIRESFAQRPLVDEYCEIFRMWLEMLGLRERFFTGSEFRVAVTHDVDSGIGLSGVWQHGDNGLRTLYREIVRQRRPRSALLGAWQWMLRAFGIPDEATLFRDIVRLDAESGFSSFFFLMANGTHSLDATYDIESDAARAVIKTIQNAGGGIGLHVGLDAHATRGQLRSEWERLQRATPQARPVARSHYLAFFTPGTWRQLLDAGFMVDSTLGFSRHMGFRSSTCRAFRPFDVERFEVLPLWELPMTIMDVNLFHERGSDADRVSAVANLAARVRTYGGCLVLNWHNVSFFGHYREVYRAILAGLRGAKDIRPDGLSTPTGAVIW
jgi:hypothetical protein